MKLLVISNAAAARTRRTVPALRDALPASATVTHHLTEDAAALVELVGHDRWRPDDLLVVNGGDGSVQHVLTALLRHCPAERRPRVACLPGGSTNMTAYDLNANRRFAACLATLRRHATAGAEVPLRPRPVVRAGAPEMPAQYGLFFGIGTIVQGIEYFQQRVGVSHELGAGMALVRTVWGMARQQPPFDTALCVDIEPPGLGAADGPVAAPAGPTPIRLLLATTLERLFLGLRPYWGEGPGAMQTTLVERQAPGFLGRLPRLLRGRPDAVMGGRLGYASARLDRLRLRFAGPFTVDGELFASAGGAVDVSATEPVKFLRL